MPAWLKKMVKAPFNLSKKKQVAIADDINLGWATVADLAGIGHCASLVRAL